MKEAKTAASDGGTARETTGGAPSAASRRRRPGPRRWPQGRRGRRSGRGCRSGSRIGRCGAGLLLLLLLCLPVRLRAEEVATGAAPSPAAGPLRPSADALTLREQRHQLALQQMDERAFSEALRTLQALEAEEHDANLLLLLAMSHMGLQQCTAARALLDQYLRETGGLPKEPIVRDLHKDVTQCVTAPPPLPVPAPVAPAPPVLAPLPPPPSLPVQAPLLLLPKPRVAVSAARTPLYKRWWLWTAVGSTVAVGVGLGLGLGLSMQRVTCEPAWWCDGVPQG